MTPLNLNKAPAGKADEGFTYLDPGIYHNGRLVEIKKETITTKGGDEPTVLAFYFANADEQQHRHLEFEPGPETEDKKVLNMIARVKHILRCFDEGEITAIDTGGKDLEFDTFDDFCRWAISTVEPAMESQRVDFKIVGNINNKTGKPFASFPGYLGFIVPSGSGEAIRFSTRELSQNKEYQTAIKDAGGTATDADLTSADGTTQGEDGESDPWLTDAD